MSADLALQKAVYAALAADAALAALVAARIYDNPPDDVGLPYLTLGESETRDWSTGESRGAEHLLSLHAFSRRGGRAEAKEILAAVGARLHDAALTLEGHALVNLRLRDSETRREADGTTWRGTIRFRAVTEEA
ncbi:MAG: DUF3168 domain-containing protein [Parvibaculum sp.]|uniref:DUF3168 domain-containing protein n=1 Tax=Parvibaculum sp. TaxID=2024848 RepID=UPI002728C8AD|nr:DUF3168 domain-containing protein [Parvibaculum sp.]MDO8838512.1 DUF3168 domain-containing protein [Parvibaculum sp.]